MSKMPTSRRGDAGLFLAPLESLRLCVRRTSWNGPVITFLGLALAVAAGLLLIRLTPLGGALFILLTVGGLATVLEPLAGLLVMLFLAPLWAYLRAELVQVPAQISQVFFVLTLGVWVARGMVHRSAGSRVGRWGRKTAFLLLALAVFVGAALLSLWDAVELPVYGIPELAKWVQITLLFLFVSTYLTRRRLPWLVGGLLAVGVFQACVGIWQFGLRGDGPEHFAILDGSFYRAYGTFEQPNPYAGFLGLMLPLAVGVVVGVVGERLQNRQGDEGTRRRVARRPLVGSPPGPQVLLTSGVLVPAGVAVALGAALLASWSRGGWLGFGAAAVVMALALPRKARWGILVVAVLAVGALGLQTTGLMPASVEARLTGFAEYVRFEDVRGVGINDANYAVIERLAHWQAALEMWRYNFWTGVGFGCYEPAYRGFGLINWRTPLGHAHNYYLNIAAETGLIGLVAYLFLWGVVFWQTWRATRRGNGLSRGLAIGLLGTWTHLSVHHLFDNLYVNNVHLHVGVLLGLLAYIARRVDESANSPSAVEGCTESTNG
jgi:putative inorganic carbon (HCO3(-)) transporter